MPFENWMQLPNSAVAHNHGQLHKNAGATQGQALQIYFYNWNPSGSGHHGQLCSSLVSPQVWPSSWRHG
jgi:hypothetical protein